MRHLVLNGILRANNQFELQSSYLSDLPEVVSTAHDSETVIELRDEHGAPLLRQPVLAPYYCFGDAMSDNRRLHAAVPFHPATRAIGIVHEGIDVRTVPVSERPPALRLTWRPPARASGRQRVTWEASHPEGLPVRAFLRYSWNDGASWQRIGGWTEDEEAEIDLDQLPGGRACRIAVVATAGVNTTVEVSRRFAVREQPLRALILSPADGARVAPGTSILFHGQGFSLEDQAPVLEPLSWTIDGQPLADGPTFERTDIPPGAHEIRLTAGAAPRAGSATIWLTVLTDQETTSA